MHDALYQYLILYNQLSLPGIGTICMKKKSSGFDYGNKIFTAPVYQFILESRQDKPSKKFFEWLSATLNITDWEAVRLVNDFSFDLKNKISIEGKGQWQQVGVFLRDEKGNIILDSPLTTVESEKPVYAEKIIREKAEHPIRVGDMEKTSLEMEELLSDSAVKKDYGWMIAVVLTLLSLLFIGWHFSEKGLHPSSAANQSIIKTK